MVIYNLITRGNGLHMINNDTVMLKYAIEILLSDACYCNFEFRKAILTNTHSKYSNLLTSGCFHF